MSPTEFEEFCFELMRQHGFVNLDWPKGTGTNASPADSGRDIVGQLRREDVDGTSYLETWFVDAKHHKTGVPPDKVTGLLAWAQAERADVALIIASNFLSNPCKDFLAAHERNNKPYYRIKWWERPTLQRLYEGNEEVLDRLFKIGSRTLEEIRAAEQEYADKIWYDRKVVLWDKIAKGEESKFSPEILVNMRAAMRKLEQRYGGAEVLMPENDFDWGLWNGKLSALRWVLGDEWDFLDT